MNSKLTTFGTLLGTSSSGIEAYSNGTGLFLSSQQSKIDELILGVKWQCVEYTRRWLFRTYGLVYSDVNFAYELWEKINAFIDSASNEAVKTININNGSITALKVGDLLVYSKEYLGTGHVAVILSIDLEENKIYIGEQNYLNQHWPGDYARELTLKKEIEGFLIVDELLLGIKRIKQQHISQRSQLKYFFRIIQIESLQVNFRGNYLLI